MHVFCCLFCLLLLEGALKSKEKDVFHKVMTVSLILKIEYELMLLTVVSSFCLNEELS